MSAQNRSSRLIRLGTRRSLLARAQSGWVAREVERLNPGVNVELVGIDTRGDKILDVPLTAVQGKEFFVAELDDALHSGRVDFTVHSMKDLSLDRPAAFCLAAVPRRENPRDVILFGPSLWRKLEDPKAGPVRIGTSSPRRLENLPAFLSKALPLRSSHGRPALQFVEIRGNVNTRLARVHEPDESERALDGVVLAFAGLIRLWADAEARLELASLLKGVRWMILPLTECPAAPAQGALAVECRRDDAEIRSILGPLHSAGAAQSAARERQLLADWGGGCHQRFGATALSHSELGELLLVRGKKSTGESVDEYRWTGPAPITGSSALRAWDGMEERLSESASVVPVSAGVSNFVFVSHARAVQNASQQLQNQLQGRSVRVWTSGASSWFQLAEQGLFVEGCAEGFGFEFLAEQTLRESVLALASVGEEWTILTHAGALDGWGNCRTLATYEVPADAGIRAGALEKLKEATDVFWGSATQWAALHAHVSPSARQACGPGKTASALKAAGVAVQIFPGTAQWRQCVGLPVRARREKETS